MGAPCGSLSYGPKAGDGCGSSLSRKNWCADLEASGSKTDIPKYLSLNMIPLFAAASSESVSESESDCCNSMAVAVCMSS